MRLAAVEPGTLLPGPEGDQRANCGIEAHRLVFAEPARVDPWWASAGAIL